jgi:hypothetical protein
MSKKNRKNRNGTNEAAVVVTEAAVTAPVVEQIQPEATQTEVVQTAAPEGEVIGNAQPESKPSVEAKAAEVAAQGGKIRQKVSNAEKAKRLRDQQRRLELKTVAEENPSLRKLVHSFLVRNSRQETLTEEGSADLVKRRQEVASKEREALQRQLAILEDRVALLKAKLGDTSALTVRNTEQLLDVRAELIKAAMEISSEVGMKVSSLITEEPEVTVIATSAEGGEKKEEKTTEKTVETETTETVTTEPVTQPVEQPEEEAKPAEPEESEQGAEQTSPEMVTV